MTDVGTGQILDVFEEHDAADLRAWMGRIPLSWSASVEVVSVHPHEGYRSAVINPHPVTQRASPLADVTVVADSFHLVRLANQARDPAAATRPAGHFRAPGLER